MPCKNCGEPQTIKAHLIPKVFCKQIQEGKSHAAQVTETGNYRISQSGIWDCSILCSECDNNLGELENYAHSVFSKIRENGSDLPWKLKEVIGVNNKKILRFCSAILYKFSLTDDFKGKIDLKGYQETCRRIAFGECKIPNYFNAFFWRAIRFPNDKGQFVYRAPLPDQLDGIDLYRMMLGGMLIFVKIDKRKLPVPELDKIMIRGKKSFVYRIVPAQGLEEFKVPNKIIDENKSLSSYLDGLKE